MTFADWFKYKKGLSWHQVLQIRDRNPELYKKLFKEYNLTARKEVVTCKNS